jgi:hypothetical protein
MTPPNRTTMPVPSRRTLSLGPVPTVWGGNGPDSAFALADDLLEECRPSAVQLHTWEPEQTARKAKALLPGVQIIVGVGVDQIARDVAKGTRSVEWGKRTLVTLADRASNCGALAVCWNAEASWKRPPSSEERKRLSEVVRGALNDVAAKFPKLAQWHTAYDHPTYHSTYNWSDWIGPDSPVVASFPQVYAAPADPNAVAARDAVDRREAKALSSWALAVKKNWIDVDVPDGQPGDETDVDWRPYYQLHSVRAEDTIDSAVLHSMAAFWAIPTRADKAGRNSLRALCDLWSRGLWGAGCIEELQRRVGVKVDRRYGPKTAAAAGVRWELP